MGVAAFHSGLALSYSVLDQVLREADQQFAADVGVRDFPASKLDDGFDSIAFLQKANGVIFLEIVIVIVGVGAEFQLLHLDDVLFALGFVLFLFVLVLPLAVVHRFGDRWLGCGGNEDKIEAHALGFANGLVRGHDFNGTVGEDGADFACADGFVYVFADTRAAGYKTSWIHRARVPPADKSIII